MCEVVYLVRTFTDKKAHDQHLGWECEEQRRKLHDSLHISQFTFFFFFRCAALQDKDEFEQAGNVLVVIHYMTAQWVHPLPGAVYRVLVAQAVGMPGTALMDGILFFFPCRAGLIFIHWLPLSCFFKSLKYYHKTPTILSSPVYVTATLGTLSAFETTVRTPKLYPGLVMPCCYFILHNI